MTIWLYTLTQNNDAGTFQLKDGSTIAATAQNFVKCIIENTLTERARWGVRNLYKDIEIGDEIYIYGIGQDLVGCAHVIDKFDQDKEIELKFDMKRTLAFIESKIPFSIVEQYLINKTVRLSSVIRIDERIKTIINQKLNLIDTLPIQKNLLCITAIILINRIWQSKKYQDEWLTYQELSEEIYRKSSIIIEPIDTKEPIGELSKICFKIGLPLISCIVINKDRFEPGTGFFDLYSQLTGKRLKSDDKDMIWIEESKKVFEFKEWNKLLKYLNPKLNIDELSAKTLDIGSIDNPKTKVKEYEEGKALLKEHIVRERNPLVIKNAKIAFFKKHGRLFCEACGFDFYEVYGEIGKNYIEGHHTKMVSQMNEGDMTKVEDIAMLCCNCHKMIHNSKNIYSVEKLKEIIKIKCQNL